MGLWEQHQKWLWIDGELQRFNLLTDPSETSPEILAPDATPERLDQAIAGLADLSSRAEESNEALLEKLRALGYVD